MWGVATSYQSEGGITNNDWHYFTTSNSIKKRISTLTKPSIFYNDIRHLQLQSAGELWSVVVNLGSNKMNRICAK